MARESCWRKEKAKGIKKNSTNHMMGNGTSLPAADLTTLLDQTNFKEKELKRWFKKFIHDYPDGRMSRDQFMDIYTKIYKSGSAERLAEHIFRSFDTNGDDEICFKELMCCFSVTSRGSVREKLEWAFNVYDLDNSGVVTIDEVRDIVKCMQQNANTVD